MASSEMANVGKAVAARVGSNIREVRKGLSLTQAQLAAPEFSISYISALERGKIRPSLRALSILAKRLDVPLTFLLEGSPSGAAEARAVGYSPSDGAPDLKVEVELLHARALIEQGRFTEADHLLAPLKPERITTGQAYQLFLLCGRVHLGLSEPQEAVVDLRQAVTQADGMGCAEYAERARNLLGRGYYLLNNYTLALENHQRCAEAIESHQIEDPLFALDVYGNLGDDCASLGEQERATGYYQQALLTLAGLRHRGAGVAGERKQGQGEQEGDLEGGRFDSGCYAEKYLEIGLGYKAATRMPVALEFLTRSLAIYAMRGEQRRVGTTHRGLGKALERQGDLDGAEREYREAVAIEEELGDDLAASACHASLSELLARRGKTDEAEQEAQAALACAERSGDLLQRGLALIALAQLSHNARDYQGSDELFTQALDLLEQSKASEQTAAAYWRYGNLLEARGEAQRSLNAYKKAYRFQARERDEVLA